MAVEVDAREKAIKTNNKKEFVVKHELKFARILAGNSKTSRDKALKALKQWFTRRSKIVAFSEDDFQRIWKGLFYTMWMSDKPLIQEECAENISSLVHFSTIKDSILFFKAGMTILMNEWFGIDQLRLDKFLMLVRRFLRQIFIALKRHGLTKKNIDSFSDALSCTILSSESQPPIGLFMHFTEIFLEEFAKVIKDSINPERFVDFLRPFIKKLAVTDDHRQRGQITKFIFTFLIRQSDLGLEYQAKYEAWKNEGFPGSIDSMQKIKLAEDEMISEGDDSAENEERKKPLDPRAGRVDVELPQIRFKPKLIADALLEYKFDKDSNTKSRHLITGLAEQFTKLANGVYPLGVKKVRDDKKDSYDTSIRKAMNRLVKFDKKLMGRDKKRKRKNDKDEGELEVKSKRKKSTESTSESSNVDPAMIDEPNDFLGRNELPVIKKIKKRRNGINIEFDERTPVEENQKKTKKKRKNKVNNVNKDLEQVDQTIHGGIKKKEATVKADLSIHVRKGVNSATNVRSAKENLTIKRVTSGEVPEDKDLTRFIKESEGKIVKNIRNGLGQNKVTKNKRKNKNLKKNRDIINNIECVFVRNSGTWIVYDTSKEESEVPTRQIDTLTSSLTDFDDVTPVILKTPIKSPKNSTTNNKAAQMRNKDTATPSKSKTISTNANETPLSPVTEQNLSPKSGLSPVKLFESPPKQKELFPKSEWDEPLQEGEYEICIPSKKYAAKMKTRQSLHEMTNTSGKIKGKRRLSMDSSLAKNPFSTPSSTKKVKINTKLNRSQEVHEHVAQIKSSPGIPYDANKKPSKPLLKANFCSTPIDPFYNKQLNTC